MNRSLGATLFVALAALSGCESKMAPVGVSGNVTLGGAPLDGAISFFPTSGSQQPAGSSAITAGKYSIPAGSGLTRGEYRVEIRSAANTGATPGPGESPPPVNELVPARYNTKSDLTAGLYKTENTADFDLKPK